MCPTAELLAEGWRVCTRDARYEVHLDGRIRNRKTGRVLKPQQAKGGLYQKVALGRPAPGQPNIQVQVHQLVCETWHGPKPEGLPHQVDHVDFDTHRNVATNVRWLRSSLNGPGHRSSYAWAARAAEVAPDDWSPMTPEEEAAILDRMAANGW